jgi:DNA-directed RNA polymerase subunit RPC12/RpoP
VRRDTCTSANAPEGYHLYRPESFACINCGAELEPLTVAEGLILWCFDGPVGEATEIRCPWQDCGAWVPAKDWARGSFLCAACGAHETLKCPRCGSEFDHVVGQVLEVREP